MHRSALGPREKQAASLKLEKLIGQNGTHQEGVMATTNPQELHACQQLSQPECSHLLLATRQIDFPPNAKQTSKKHWYWTATSRRLHFMASI